MFSGKVESKRRKRGGMRYNVRLAVAGCVWVEADAPLVETPLGTETDDIGEIQDVAADMVSATLELCGQKVDIGEFEFVFEDRVKASHGYYTQKIERVKP